MKWISKFIIKEQILEMPELPSFDINPIKEFALNGWELGKTHGLPHWQRVERNGVILSTEVRDGKLYIRKDVNITVVRLFAYLHDKCRVDNYEDLEHGKRAADMLYTIKDTLIKDLTVEEFSLLEKACRYHTIEHRTGNTTIDTCFDADRLDLDRVGIMPNPKLMATKQGACYADDLYRLKHTEPFMTYYKDIIEQ